MESLFEYIPAHLIKHVTNSLTTTNEIDGMETIGHLYVIEMFCQEYLHINIHDAIESNDQDIVIEKNSFITIYLIKILKDVNKLLLSRFEIFTSLQLQWIGDQYGDAKKTSLFIPFLKIPTFIDQIQEMTGGLSFKCIDDFYVKLCKKLFHWLDQMVALNEKYADVAKIQNYTFFIETMKIRNIPIFEPFLQQAIQIKTDALQRYLEWMLTYEFPILMDIGSKVELANSKIGRESGGLELYVKRYSA
jgi:hypothetical protein